MRPCNDAHNESDKDRSIPPIYTDTIDDDDDDDIHTQDAAPLSISHYQRRRQSSQPPQQQPTPNRSTDHSNKLNDGTRHRPNLALPASSMGQRDPPPHSVVPSRLHRPRSFDLPSSHARAAEGAIVGPGSQRSSFQARESGLLESLSKTIRTYVTSSIRVPNTISSSPRVSQPVSFGTFIPTRNSALGPRPLLDDGPSAFDKVEKPGTSLTVYPTDSDDLGQTILWARWDTLPRAGQGSMQLLFIAYASGIQIWDCTNLASVNEILNLAGPRWRHISFAAVLPHPTSEQSVLRDERPLVGMICDGQFVIYSLYKHYIVKVLSFSSFDIFSANEHYLILSSTHPTALHILCSRTLSVLHTLANRSIFLSEPPFSSSVDKAYYEQDNTITNTPQSHPVFALSHRLLAYVSPPPSPARPSSPTHQSRVSAWGVDGDLSQTAVKVGEGVLSGLKVLGGMAYNAAMAKAGRNSREGGSPSLAGRGEHPFAGFSTRISSDSRDWDEGHSPEPDSTPSDTNSVLPRDSHQALPKTQHQLASRVRSRGGGGHVTVVDLSPLLKPMQSGEPIVVAELMASKSQPIVGLQFSSDGNSLVAVPRNGQVITLHQIRPVLPHQEHSASAQCALHMYNLRRGRTSAVIEGVEITCDLRWIAIAMQNRTVHMFAVNPYGGKPDARSHVEGRVRNYFEMQSLSTEVAPVLRIRLPKTPHGSPKAALAFALLDQLQFSLPGTLLPQARSPPPSRPASLPSGYPASIPLSSPPSDVLSPLYSRNAMTRNFQDLLVFDPADGMLTLRRVMIELRAKDGASSAATLLMSQTQPGRTSVSLPGIGANGRLSASPPTPHTHSGLATPAGAGTAGLTPTRQGVDGTPDIVARESIEATWLLKRKGAWGEIERVVRVDVTMEKSQANRTDWLAQAELSTSSTSSRVLPPSIYLSHQFSFHALDEDYHALIRRYQLDIQGSKLEVRKEVEISASSTGYDESFVEGFNTPGALRRTSASFDEPIASALAAGLEYAPVQQVIPMLPNGTRPRPRSFKDSLPIRTMAAGLSDGMTEGLERIRRATAKSGRRLSSSPLFTATTSIKQSSGSFSSSEAIPYEPLEFDEQDEDFKMQCGESPRMFLGEDEADGREKRVSQSQSKGQGNSGTLVSAPTLSTPLPVLGSDREEGYTLDDVWGNWERFDDISAVGLFDEEQMPLGTKMRHE